MSRLLRTVEALHARAVFGRRTRVLAAAIDAILPPDVASLADVGCGDGTIGEALLARRPALAYRGLEVMARPRARVPVELFDGRRLPLEDRAVDAVIFVDVLHHAQDPRALLAEARRVARRHVVVKDHVANGRAAWAILSLMDWVGNRPHGVTSTWRYWSDTEWRSAWDQAGLRVVRSERELGLYPAVARPVFERGLHHLTLLAV